MRGDIGLIASGFCRHLVKGSTVQQIVASLQLISVKGEFDRKSVLSQFETLSQVAFAGRIRAGSMSDAELFKEHAGGGLL